MSQNINKFLMLSAFVVAGFLIFMSPSHAQAEDYSIQFDGSNDFVSLPNNADFQPTGGSFTAEAWIYIDAGAPDDQKVLLTLGGWNKGYALNIYKNSEGKHYLTAGIYLNGHNYYAEDVSSTIATSTWTHVAMTWSQSGNLISYVNGQATDQHSTEGYAYSSSGNQVNMGIGYTNVYFAPFKGRIDELRVWDVVRTQSEIQANMNQQIATSTNLKAYYKMTNGSGTSLTDDSGNGNTGTLTNGPTWSTSVVFTQYTLAYTAGAHGSITASSTQAVNSGSSGTAVTAVADTGYHFVNWSDSSTTNPRLDTNVTSSLSLTANFAINNYTLSYTAGSGGTLTGSSTQSVNYGSNGTAVTAVANTGYHFVNWSDSSTTNPRTDTNATTSMSLTANFVINNYTLTYAAGSGGTLTGSSTQSVNYGANGSEVIAVPNTGFTFVDWSDDTTTTARTDTNIRNNASYVANFTTTTYALSYAAGTGGKISGNASQTIDYGTNGVAVTAVADNWYVFSRWSDGLTNNPRVDTNVTSSKSISAIFERSEGGATSVILPPGIGDGDSDSSASGIGVPVNVGIIDQSGTNVLTYITNTNNFTAPESSKNWNLDDHNFIITNLDLANYIVAITFNSKPAMITLKKGESKDVDLDGDKIADIKATFTNTYINRAEITIKSLSKTAIGTSTTNATNTKFIFKKNLSTGMANNDVKQLQIFLNNNGYKIAKSGAGSVGKETATFGPATRAALIKFQRAKKIKPANGILGPITRGIINK